MPPILLSPIRNRKCLTARQELKREELEEADDGFVNSSTGFIIWPLLAPHS
jgi:hypothetical protein